MRRATERVRQERIAKLLAWDPTLTVEDAWRIRDHYERRRLPSERLTKCRSREIHERMRADLAGPV